MSGEEEQPAQQSQQTIVLNSLFIGRLEEFVPARTNEALCRACGNVL